ncbi:hypothetical protein [Streptomyces sp. NPDC093707]|uniref:hypothetical protein n=1 Tax=Streptomyces sp. NPDC093707 TaxID=3154984 RepID=UPI00344E38FC
MGLHLVTVQATAEVRAFDPTKRFPFSIVDPVDAALTASEDHLRFRDAQALAQGLWQHRRTTATVEAWGPSSHPMQLAALGVSERKLAVAADPDHGPVEMRALTRFSYSRRALRCAGTVGVPSPPSRGGSC